MAHLFQMKLVRLSWSEQTATFSLYGDHCHSLVVNHRHQHFSSSSVFCLNSNTQPDSQTRNKRQSRASKQDTQLRKDLQLFLSSEGLPLDKVPSTKELSTGGREDLAKRVRRRGYKAIQALLADSNLESGTAYLGNEVHNAEGSFKEPLEGAPLTTSSVHKPLLIACAPTDTGQAVLSSLGTDIIDLQEGIKLETELKDKILLGESVIEKEAEEELHMKAAEFVRTGKLDQVPDFNEEEDDDNDVECMEVSSDEEEIPGQQDEQIKSEVIAAEKAARLRAKLLPFVNIASDQTKIHQPKNQGVVSVIDSLQKSKVLEVDQESTQIMPQTTSGTDMELQRIKAALISKEKELGEVSRDLVETKAQLALVQAKATAEGAQARQLALEKDIRLKSADLALANLKRAQVEYWGEGGRVELAGSFNGWQHFIHMEPDPTSEIIKPDGSRGPMMWESELWLYPGVYEIKFIVDGNWQIDQRREMVIRNSLHNNLLRVEP